MLLKAKSFVLSSFESHLYMMNALLVKCTNVCSNVDCRVFTFFYIKLDRFWFSGHEVKIEENSGVATSTSLFLFDSFDMNSLWFKSGNMVSSTASIEYWMPIFSCFLKWNEDLKIESFVDLKQVQMSWYQKNPLEIKNVNSIG